MWNLLRPGVKPVSPVSTDRFETPGPPETHANLDFALWNSGSENFPVPTGTGRQENDYETALLNHCLVYDLGTALLLSSICYANRVSIAVNNSQHFTKNVLLALG